MPPDIAQSWDECNVIAKAVLIAYNQIRDYEHQEAKNDEMNMMAKMMGVKSI